MWRRNGSLKFAKIKAVILDYGEVLVAIRPRANEWSSHGEFFPGGPGYVSLAVGSKSAAL